MPLLLGLIRFPAVPTDFPEGAGPADIGAEHVVKVISTLVDFSGEDRWRARMEIARLIFADAGWTVSDAATTYLAYRSSADAVLPRESIITYNADAWMPFFTLDDPDDVLFALRTPRLNISTK